MSVIIKDGTGKGSSAEVDNTNKLSVRAVQSTEFQDGILEGRVFVISSGIVTLTSANASGIIYVKNNDSRDMLVSDLNVFVGNSTGGTAASNFVSTSTINPTGGTLISTATTVVPVNLNLGSSLTASIDAFSGAEAKTVTGGVGVSDLYPDSGRFLLEDAAILPKGFSLAISITPKASNSNVDVIVTLALQFLEKRGE